MSTVTTRYLPPASFTAQQIAPRDTLARVAQPVSTTQTQLAADNATLRVIYGRCRIGAQIVQALAWQGNLVLLLRWGKAPIDAIEQLFMDDAPAPSSVTVVHYLGGAHAPSATMVSAWAAQRPSRTYADAPAGTAYSVAVVPPGLGAGFPRFAAVVRGRKLFDPRNGPAPDTTALEFVSTCAGGGVCLAYRAIAAPTYTIQSGDVLTYDFWIDPRNPVVATGAGAIEIEVTTSPLYGRDVPGFVDQRGDHAIYIGASWATGTWATRTLSLAAFVGKALSRILLVNESDTPGWYRACYRNIRITDGGAATRLSIWSGGAPAVNYDGYNLLYSTVAAAEVQSTKWSDNPALMLADFAQDTSGYGMGLVAGNVVAAANACDELVGGEKRRTCGLTLDEPALCEDWLEAMRTYAGCLLDRSGAELKLVPDRPVSVSGTLDASTVRLRGLRKRGIRDVPTVVRVNYTDTTTKPWRTQQVTAKAPGVDGGTVEWRESLIELEGVQRRSQALREATERLNKRWLQDLTADVEVLSDGLKFEIGDVPALTHPVGLSAKPMRVMGIGREKSRPLLRLEEYDPAAYSDIVVAEPTWDDTTLPTPANPPQVTGLVLSQIGQHQSDGTWVTCIGATWTGVTYPFFLAYQVTVFDGSAVIYSTTLQGEEVRTPPLPEYRNYRVEVQTLSTIAASSPVVAMIYLDGKATPPANVPYWITALEAGGDVYLAWPSVADADLALYEIRMGATGGTFATASVVARLSATTAILRSLPAGATRFYVVAEDRSGNQSLTPLVADISITQDPSLLIVNKTFASPTPTSMTRYTRFLGGAGTWVTDFGDGIGFGHADTNNATGTFADLSSVAFAHPHTAGTSALETESWDLGSSIAGDWTITAAVTALSGAATVKLRLSENGSTWTDTIWTGAPIRAAGRYARVRIETTGSMTVEEPIQAGCIVSARVDPNGGIVTTASSGPTTIALAGHYTRAIDISITPSGTAAATVTWDNVVLGAGANTFDIYAFNAAGAQIAASVAWSFTGY